MKEALIIGKDIQQISQEIDETYDLKDIFIKGDSEIDFESYLL